MQVGHSQWPQLCLQANKYIKKQAYEDHYPQVWFSYQNHSTSPSIGDVLLTCLITRGTWMVFLTALSIYMQKLEPSRLEAVCWRLKKKCACQCCWKLGIWCWKFHIWWLFQNAMQLGKNLLATPVSVHLSLPCDSHVEVTWKLKKPRRDRRGLSVCAKKLSCFGLRFWTVPHVPCVSSQAVDAVGFSSGVLKLSGSSASNKQYEADGLLVTDSFPLVGFTINHPQALTNNSWLLMGCMLTIPKWIGINKMKLYHIKKDWFSLPEGIFWRALTQWWCF